jgi:hypothetical protein
MNYYPKRPVKSFQDLEVYQRTLNLAVALAKRIKSDKINTLALDLPVKIATAHSVRFSDHNKALQTLEEVMLNCNLLVVYLEQYRDLENKEIETEFFAEQIKNLLTARMKIMRLQRSWKKFMEEKSRC